MSERVAKIILAAVLAYILVRACLEFHTVAWGTGVWLGEFSLKWGFGFFAFVLLCILTFIPIKFVHPLRVTHWREITVPMTVLWAAMSLSLIIQAKDRAGWGPVEDVQLWVWVAASLYFLFISLYRTFIQKDPESDHDGEHAA